MEFLKYAQSYKNQMIEKLSELVSIKSTLINQPEVSDAPFGEECVKALLYMLDLGEKLGFKVKNVDNVCGHIEYGEGEEIVAVLCHVDVVPADGVWASDPYVARVEGDRLYARGSIDDKGPAITALYSLYMLKEMGYVPNKRIRLIIGTDEESGSRGLKRYLEVEETPTTGFSPDADFPLIYGEKGMMSIDILSDIEPKELTIESGTRYNIVPSYAKASYPDYSKEFLNFINEHGYEGKINEDVLETFGVACHAMEPRNGVNAALHMAESLEKVSPLCKFASHCLKDSRLECNNLNFTDYEMGDMTCNFAVLNVSDGHGKIGLNFRYPVRWDKDEFVEKFTNLARSYGLNLVVLHSSKPHYISPEDKLVKTLLNAYQTFTGDYTSKIKTIGGGTYARSLPHAVAFGQVFPNEEDLAHQANEYISISNMVTSCAIYAQALVDLTK